MIDREKLAPVRTDADLLRFWQTMMGAGGFAQRSLWIVWFDEHGVSLPIVVPIDDLPHGPDEQLTGNLMRILGQTIDESEATSAALLLSRPGDARKRDGDAAWARGLLAAAKRHGIPLWPVHLATTDRVQPMTPDDLVA